jgi:hypothetical protein
VVDQLARAGVHRADDPGGVEVERDDGAVLGLDGPADVFALVAVQRLGFVAHGGRLRGAAKAPSAWARARDRI